MFNLDQVVTGTKLAFTSDKHHAQFEETVATTFKQNNQSIILFDVDKSLFDGFLGIVLIDGLWRVCMNGEYWGLAQDLRVVSL